MGVATPDVQLLEQLPPQLVDGGPAGFVKGVFPVGKQEIAGHVRPVAVRRLDGPGHAQGLIDAS